MTKPSKYYGKYRGTVVSNADPEQRGRIQASVPDVFSGPLSSWALPCVPIAGNQNGIFVVPQNGARVWIEFEHGDVNFPIWTGGFWNPGEVPPLALAGSQVSPSIVLQTALQNAIVISDMAGPVGGIMLTARSGAAILINDAGISIANGKGATINMHGATIDFNLGALTVP